MAYKLKRDVAEKAILDVIAGQNNDMLQLLYMSAHVKKYVGQENMFKLWHGFIPVEDISDEGLNALCCAVGCDFEDLHDEIDYSYLIDEYLDTLANENTRRSYSGKLRVIAFAANNVLHKDLQEMTREDARDLSEAMLDQMSFSTVESAAWTASSFCQWCIKNDKYPNAQNNFTKLPPIDVSAYVKRCIPQDDMDLTDRLARQIVFDEGEGAAPILMFAWMGFTRQEILDMRNEDVDFFNETVKGVPIPTAFTPALKAYTFAVDVGMRGNSAYEYHLEDLGFFVKRLVIHDTGARCDKVFLNNSVSHVDLSFDNVATSGQFYRLYQREQQEGPISDKEFCELFGIKKQKTCYTKKQIYNTYKSLYWGSSD